MSLLDNSNAHRCGHIPVDVFLSWAYASLWGLQQPCLFSKEPFEAAGPSSIASCPGFCALFKHLWSVRCVARPTHTHKMQPERLVESAVSTIYNLDT